MLLEWSVYLILGFMFLSKASEGTGAQDSFDITTRTRCSREKNEGKAREQK